MIPPIKDFELFAATSQELETDWHDALRSHLIGYIESGKIVPVPHPRIQQQSNTKGTAGGVQQFMVTDGEVVPT
ncbi:MAG: hypothetical protein U0994_13500 [Gemmatimonadales bacterium]|nr:hypothetical protein [Gemmatimonadales bacterium]